MLELLYTSTKTIDLGSSPRGVFIASWDALLYDGWLYGTGFRKVFKDGTTFNMADTKYTFLSAEGGRGAALLSSNDIVMVDEISGLPILGESLNAVSLSGKASSGSFVDQVRGLVYTRTGTDTIAVYSLQTGSLVRTLALSGVTNYSNTNLHDGGPSRLFLSTRNVGQVALIDRLTGAVIFQGAVTADNQAAVYDTVHNVVIAVLNSGQIAVYALENAGANLSAPSFNPAPALFTLSKVSTRLTSGDGQGVAGKAVLWYLAFGKGNLEKPWSLTDGDGYAHNWYYGPPGAYGLGEETIHVEAVV